MTSFLNIVIVFCCLELSMSCIDGSVMDAQAIRDRSIKKIHNQVYARYGEPMDPSVTYAKMKELHQYYSELKDPDSQRRKLRLEKLIELGDVSEEKCQIDDALGLQEYVEICDLNCSINIRAYVMHYHQVQFDICESMRVDLIQSKLASLKEGIKHNINTLRKFLAQADPSARLYKVIEPATLKAGLVAFMKYRSRALLAPSVLGKQNPMRNFEPLYKQIVVNLCNPIDTELNSIIDHYKPFLAIDELVQRINKATLDWIVCAKICKQVMTNRDRLAEEILETLAPWYKAKRSLRCTLLATVATVNTGWSCH